jgi:SAM-dependent methyltransferase
VESEGVFDVPVARDYVKMRLAFVATFVETVRKQLELASALDVGCGVGYFSKFLSDMNFRVVAVDGREENVVQAKKRYPKITFLRRNVEDPALLEMGKFELVLSVGLLYHLENPFRAIRNLHSMTDKLLLIETMCVPSLQPTMDLLDEAPAENQGLNYVAFYPSESCLIKMLYRAGFPFVYRFKRLPKCKPFASTFWRKKSRTFLAASNIALTAPNLVLAEEPCRPVPSASDDPWSTFISRLLGGRWSDKVSKMSFLIKPRHKRTSSLSSK